MSTNLIGKKITYDYPSIIDKYFVVKAPCVRSWSDSLPPNNNPFSVSRTKMQRTISPKYFPPKSFSNLAHNQCDYRLNWKKYNQEYVNDPARREFLSTSLSNSVFIKSKTPLSPKAPHSISMTTFKKLKVSARNSKSWLIQSNFYFIHFSLYGIYLLKLD